jgi:hypothetical protein
MWTIKDRLKIKELLAVVPKGNVSALTRCERETRFRGKCNSVEPEPELVVEGE